MVLGDDEAGFDAVQSLSCAVRPPHLAEFGTWPDSGFILPGFERFSLCRGNDTQPGFVAGAWRKFRESFCNFERSKTYIAESG